MADENQNVADDGQQSDGKNVNDDGQQSDKPPKTIPYGVFQEKVTQFNDLKTKMTELETKLTTIDTDKTEAERAKLVADGEFKLLNETLTTENAGLKTQVSDFTKTQTELSELKDTIKADILAQLPETMRESLKAESLNTLRVVLKTLPESQKVITDVSDPNNIRTHKDGFGKNGEYKSRVDWAAGDPDGYAVARKAETTKLSMAGMAGTIKHMRPVPEQ